MPTKPDERPEAVQEAHRAIVNGKHEWMRRAIELGLDVNDYLFDDYSDKKVFTALHYALKCDTKAPVVEVLLKAGADVNAWTRGCYLDKTPLMMAAQQGRLDLVRLLLAAGADLHAAKNGYLTALFVVCGSKSSSHAAVFRELQALGAAVDARVLARASDGGSTEVVRLILESGVSPNELSDWGLPLHSAVNSNRIDITEILLGAGADPNIRLPSDFRQKDWTGKSALELAREKKNKKMIGLLEGAAPGGGTVATVKKLPPADIATAWQILAKLLKTADAKIARSLNRGASDAKICELESAIGITLPADVRESFAIHDGQKDGSEDLFPEDFLDLDSPFQLLSLGGALADWKVWTELEAGGVFKALTPKPDKGVRKAWYHPKWVPIANNGGGDSLCVDLAPAKGGKAGQVILVSHEDGRRPRLTDSLTELLGKLCDHFEQESGDAE